MITLITGGARSGKSTYAESIYHDRTDVVYIATSRIEDSEMADRIMLHQSTRPSSWRTFEGNYKLKEAIGGESCYLLDCMTVLSSNIMFDLTKNMDKIDIKTQQTVEETICCELISLIDEIREQNKNLILVTNEVGLSIVPEHHISRVYRDILGKVNQKIAALSDEVTVLFCGLPLKLK